MRSPNLGPLDPYSGVAESGVTSNVMPLRNALEWSLSVWTTSGATSRVTIQLSNSGATSGGAAAASWSNYTAFTVSETTVVPGPDQYVRWGRILRTASGASLSFSLDGLEV